MPTATTVKAATIFDGIRYRGSAHRYTFSVRLALEDGAVVTLRGCLASYGVEGWVLRMPEDRDGSPLVTIPKSWYHAILAAVAERWGEPGVPGRLATPTPPDPLPAART